MDDWPECTIADHNKNKIIGFCTHFRCKSKQKLLCFNCMTQTTHDDHKAQEDGVIEFNKLPNWLNKQQEATSKFKNILDSILEKILKPIQMIEKTIDSQLEILSEQNLKNLTYTSLNDAIRIQVNLGIIMDLFSKSCLTKWFDILGGMLDRVRELMTEQNITFSTCQKRLSSIVMYLFVQISPFSKTGSINSIQLQSIGNNNYPQTNLYGICSQNQINNNVQDTFQSFMQSLSQIYDDNINNKIDLTTDATFYDGIEYLMERENEKAQIIFKTLSNQPQNMQDVQLWLAYCAYVSKQYEDSIKMIKQLGQQDEEYKQNPFFWYITTMSVIGLRHSNDAQQCILKYLRLLPRNFKGWILAGLILIKKGEYELATKYLLHVLRLEKQNIQAKYYLCLAYLYTNQQKLAESQYLEIQKIDPKSKFLNDLNVQFKQQRKS